jgi:hypothetical protein
MKTRTKKDSKKPLLILAIILLLSFIGLFVGAKINRDHLKKELIVMLEEKHLRNESFESRLTQLELRNQKITRIIGRDETVEKWIDELRGH